MGHVIFIIMAVLYLIEQGATLYKQRERLVVKKKGEVLQWVHAFKIDQIVIIGNIQLSPSAIAFLLKEGIDTVFLSTKGKYRGRLISQFGKNIILRQQQFRCFDDASFILELAKSFVSGKLKNCRTLLRRHNRELHHPEIELSIHRLRNLIQKIPEATDLDTLRGIEGKGSNCFFQGFRHAIKAEGINFFSRTRRPPRDEVNVLLSYGYTLLGNTIQTVLSIVGLDPFLGALHGVDYGRPSLVLDLMEEFRPLLVDTLVLRVLNKRIITKKDFYLQESPLTSELEEGETADISDYPIILAHEGVKKWIVHYENHLDERLFYTPLGKQLTYRDICLEQARLLVRHLKGEDKYQPFLIR
jgi:CRISPR-associated protein Cas1